MKKQMFLLILVILSGFILSREALADTMSTIVSDTDQCQAIPTCESLGYIKTPSDCGSIPYISCPLDKNKVFCPFDCAPYPLDGCNDSIGECEQCSLEGKWRYTSCIDGYSLYEGKCTPQNCEEDGALFKSGPPNTTIADESQIEYCWKDGDRYFRYRGCKHGWGYDSENFQCEMITDCNKDSKNNGKKSNLILICVLRRQHFAQTQEKSIQNEDIKYVYSKRTYSRTD